MRDKEEVLNKARYLSCRWVDEELYSELDDLQKTIKGCVVLEKQRCPYRQKLLGLLYSRRRGHEALEQRRQIDNLWHSVVPLKSSKQVAPDRFFCGEVGQDRSLKSVLRTVASVLCLHGASLSNHRNRSALKKYATPLSLPLIKIRIALLYLACNILRNHKIQPCSIYTKYIDLKQEKNR